ncbi:MAG: ribosome recycling factor [Thermoleophilia bacterium]|jgi:ribosome recycling factor|nr:ribosome recycling factor [Thermoleophilia bacterium]
MASHGIGSTRNRMTQAVNTLKRQLSGMRTGRVTVALVATLRVDAWGSRMPLEQVAQITVQQPRGLTITPHDQALTPAIEKALGSADLGATPRNDDGRLRIEIPAPTDERRVLLRKQANDLAEEARVAIRLARRDSINDLKKRRAKEEISEGKLHGRTKDMQAMTDEHVEQVDKLLRAAMKSINE